MRISVFLFAVALGGPAAENPIDRDVEARLGGVRPTGPCSEPEFLRRVTLDLTGIVPFVDDAKAYLAKPDREKLVDGLLATPEFDAWWARFFLELLTDRRAARYETHNGRLLYDWLREQLHQHRRYDEIVRDLLLAKGTWEDAPQVNFVLRYNARPSDLTGAVGRAFLGVKIQCAQCHDHPFDPWKQEEFWAVAGFFARTKRYFVEDADVVGVTDVRRAAMPEPGEEEEEGNPEKPKIAVKPRWLGAKEPASKADRAELAQYVTADPLFAKNLVNRVWAKLMGHGIVEPLDGFGAETEPSHPELLETLSRIFVESHYDLRKLIRLIVTSKTYQRSCASNDSPPRLFARALLRPLSSDQLYLSILRATRVGWDEDGSENPPESERMEPNEEELDYLDYYPPELLGGAGSSLRRALALLNHGDLHAAIDAGARFIMKSVGKPVREEHFEYAYLALLTRLPTNEEHTLFAGKSRRSDLEDALWALLNSVEFRMNH